MDNGVFQGIKVAEFAWVVVGPSSSRYLAEHGATVVKIESHKRMDTLRSSSPFANNKPTPDSSMFFGRHNPDKYSVSLDLQHPNGKQLAWKLIEWADIVTESFSPGTMEKMGFGYEAVSKVKPDVIYLSSSMQGRGGPHSSYAGYGMNAVNLCGFTEVSGSPNGPPSAPYGAYTDYICARFNALALIAALDHRRKTGKGQYIEQSQFETAIHFLSPPIMDYQVNARVTQRRGNRVPNAAPHGVFPCRGDDNWIAVSVLTDQQWENFCQAIGNPDLSVQQEYTTLAARKRNEDRLDKLISDWTIRHTREQVEEILQNAGVAASIVAKPVDVYSDPQLQHRQYWIPLNHAEMGEQMYDMQSCFILSKNPRQIKSPPPCLGEHNEYVFKELLKMTDEEIAEHIVDGSITTKLDRSFNISM
jgi:crotonobetainyl-CoA:carnitine CoA-transferase CaiB-like acyl-CoA transferase